MISVIVVAVIVMGAGWILWRRRVRWRTPTAPLPPKGPAREALAFEAFTHGSTCLAEGKFAEAIAAFQRACALDPKRPHVADRLAEVEWQQHAARVKSGLLGVLLLLPLIGCATPDWRGADQHDRYRQGVVAAHPEWPPEILAAVAAGVISAEMTPDMVCAAWGLPTRFSSDGSGSYQRVTWYYEGRQHAADMIGGLAVTTRPVAAWTVSFANGWVVGWTD